MDKIGQTVELSQKDMTSMIEREEVNASPSLPLIQDINDQELSMTIVKVKLIAGEIDSIELSQRDVISMVQKEEIDADPSSSLAQSALNSHEFGITIVEIKLIAGEMDHIELCQRDASLIVETEEIPAGPSSSLAQSPLNNREFGITIVEIKLIAGETDGIQLFQRCEPDD
jgi:hypothetical protein